MAELKTKPNRKSPVKFLSSVVDEKRREDSFVILDIMKEITGEEPVMWGDSIIGFGKYHYKYDSGREGVWFVAGFSPRKQNLTVYLMSGAKRQGELLKKLGKHKTGKGCLYINKLGDIDLKVFKQLIKKSVSYLSKYRIYE
ncbi:MAG: DUF1801 domain-containing protein [Ignavibacteria bacterium]|jgi:hypothetical protein